MSGAAGAAQQAKRSFCFLVAVGDLADGELAPRLHHQRLSGGVDGQVDVRRPCCTELPRRFEPSCRSELPRRSEPAATASSPVGVVLGSGDVSQSPDGRRIARTVVVGARSVTQPLTGDNCAVRASSLP